MEEKLKERGDDMVGRNDPCPCESGKKYKKCCGREETVDLQQVIDTELDGIMAGFAEEGAGAEGVSSIDSAVQQLAVGFIGCI